MKRRRSESSKNTNGRDLRRSTTTSMTSIATVMTLAAMTVSPNSLVSGFHFPQQYYHASLYYTTGGSMARNARRSSYLAFSAGDASTANINELSLTSEYLAFSAGDASMANINVLSLTSERPAPSRFSKLPPWLEHIEDDSADVESIQSQVQWLEFALLEHGFTVTDVADLVKAIYLCGAGDIPKMVGSIDFLKLVLKLEEPKQEKRSENVFVTKDIVLASILHYSECVDARQDGVYEKVDRAIHTKVAPPDTAVGATATWALPNDHSPRTIYMNSFGEANSNSPADMSMEDEELFPESSLSLRRKLSVEGSGESVLETTASTPPGLELFSPESLSLAQAASRIKRAEILADVVLTDQRVMAPQEYNSFRDLLLSVMEDPRALAVRCVASLYRLQGLLQTLPLGTGDYQKRDSNAIITARNSMRVYASLSGRLGLHRLKSQLEGSAFRILYPRQYTAVSTLFQQKGESMNAVSDVLTKQVHQLLHQDGSLMAQLEDLEISSRVKEPFSFWKKLITKRQEANSNREAPTTTPSLDQFLSPSSSISVAEVQDGVALRVILKAAKNSPDEPDIVTKARERMLCYYVHHLLRIQWPDVEETRVKDYIQNPKPNGYQSLHHTAMITRNGQEFPFEVQVRSQEMHQVAEFGVAAHWDYKLRSATNSLLRRTAAAVPEPVVAMSPSFSSEKTADLATESDYLSALQSARQTLVSSNVHVFLAGAFEEGQLLSLPAGAQVADVLASLELRGVVEGGSSNVQVWRNGQMALLDEEIANGDVLLVQDHYAIEATRQTEEVPTPTML